MPGRQFLAIDQIGNFDYEKYMCGGYSDVRRISLIINDLTSNRLLEAMGGGRLLGAIKNRVNEKEIGVLET